eukprot:g9876.t1
MDGRTALAGSFNDWTLVEVLVFACGELVPKGTAAYKPKKSDTAAYKPKMFSAVPQAARGLAGWQGSEVLKEWLPKQPGKLLYKASVDGWSSATFHQKCDNQGPTITIARNNDGFVFGGYAALSWNQNGAYIADNAKRSFLFSLSDGKGRAPFKCTLEKNQQHALYGGQGYGPTFGGPHDLHLNLDGYSQQAKSHSNLGFTYTVPVGMDGQTALAGSFNTWTLVEVEVYQV